MPKNVIDRIFGHSVKMCWGWDEQKVAPPLGYGNGLMVWPYRESIHFMQDQCLRINPNSVPNLPKLFEEYHKNITTKLSWWKDQVAPRAKLRARMWEGFEIYVGLNKRLRNRPNHTDGMLLIGDAAGLESTELCDGVPAAWFSAEIAAKVTIEAIKFNDTSKAFLKRYDDEIKAHPIIQWSISGRNRYNLREAQMEHDEVKLKKYIHEGWGLGCFAHVTTPLLKMIFSLIREDITIVPKWIKMFFRYYQNWLYQFNEFSMRGLKGRIISKRLRIVQNLFLRILSMIDSGIKLLSHFKKLYSNTLLSLVEYSNRFLGKILPKIEPVYLRLIRMLEPVNVIFSNKLIAFIGSADPRIFEV